MFRCCFCKKICKGKGNNPAPFYDKERPKDVCCDACNKLIVLPARETEEKRRHG